MRDLLDYGQKRVKFVEPLWWYYAKEFFREFLSVITGFLLLIVGMIIFYVFAVLFLSDWKIMSKEISSYYHQSDANDISKKLSKFEK